MEATPEPAAISRVTPSPNDRAHLTDPAGAAAYDTIAEGYTAEKETNRPRSRSVLHSAISLIIVSVPTWHRHRL